MNGKSTLLLAVAVLAGSAGFALAETVATAPLPRMAPGYLAPAQLPDSVALVPPPPADGSEALAADRVSEARALALRGSPRWDLARIDADLFTPRATSVMACAAGIAIGPQTAPRLDALLRKVAADLGMVSAAAKARYRRDRPFVGNGQPTCTPDQEPMLRGNGSYPSGHATIGYGWALILADLVPERRAQLLERGRAFADSRAVCNVHFRSDVEAGMSLAQPVLDRLQQDPAYVADLAAARAELLVQPPEQPDCTADTAALRLN